jgi:hypothetical protein
VLRESDILDAWRDEKTSRPFYRLTSEMVAAFEFRGPQFGHPSNYAAIKMVATPANEFSLDSVVLYPPSVSPSYAKKLLLAVGRAAVDELFTAAWYPYRGCKLTVQEVGWDDIMSSEVAMYRAARGALSKLRQEGQWSIPT